MVCSADNLRKLLICVLFCIVVWCAEAQCYHRIEVSKGSEDSEPVGGVSMERVDKCSISVFPPLNPDHEEIKVRELLIKKNAA